MQNKKYRIVMLGFALWNLVFMFIGGYGEIYPVRVLNVSFFQVMLWTTMQNLCRTVSVALWAKVAARIGWKNVTMLTMLMTAACGILWTMTTPENGWFMYPLIVTLLGVPYAGIGLGFFQMQVAAMPSENRSIYFSVSALLNGVAAMIGSFMCSGMISGLEGYGTAGLRLVFPVGIAGAIITIFVVRRIALEASAEKSESLSAD